MCYGTLKVKKFDELNIFYLSPEHATLSQGRMLLG